MRPIVLAVLLAPFLAGAAGAQSLPADPPEQVWDLPFAGECGLVTRYASNKINPSCLLEAQNIILDEDFTLYRRRGQAVYNTTGCNGLKSIRGAWPFDATDGIRYLIVFSSQSFFWTKGQSDCNQITASTFSATAPMNCAQGLGKLVCTNGTDIPVSIDSNLSTATLSGMPRGELVGFFRNRFLTAKVASSLTRIYGSGEGDPTDWTVQLPGKSTTPFTLDISGTNDGKATTCLLGEYQNAYYVGRDDDLFAIYGNDRRDFGLRRISDEVGCSEPKSPREKNNSLYWMSRRGVEKMSGTQITRVSDPIRPTIDEILTAAGNTVSTLDTTQADFEAGQLDASGIGAPMSSTISPGNVVASTSSRTDTSSNAGLSSGTIAGGTGVGIALNGEVTPAAVTSTYTWRYEADAIPTSAGWTYYKPNASLEPPNPSLVTVNNSTFSVKLERAQNQHAEYYLAVSGSTTTASAALIGRFAYAEGSPSGTATGNAYFGFRDGANSLNGSIQLDRNTIYYNNGPANVFSESYTIGSFSTYTIIVSTSQGIYFWRNGVFKASATFTGNVENVTLKVTQSDDQDVFGLYDFAYFARGVPVSTISVPASSTFTSRIFDMGFSTPIVSIGANWILPAGTSINFNVRNSTSPNDDMWSSFVYYSTGAPFTSYLTPKRYVQYRSTMSHVNLVDAPGLISATVLGNTTGYFISQCRNPGTAITSWNNFTCNTVSNGGAVSFAISVGTTCHNVTRATATWTTQTNNAPPSVATAAFVAYRAYFDVDVPTDAPVLQSCTISWNEGSARPAVVAEVYRDRYYLFYTTSTASGAYNEHVAVLDSNDKWTIFDGVTASAAAVYRSQLYTGDSQATGKLYIQDTGTSDNGSAFTMRFRTADLDFGDPTKPKSFKTLYVLLKTEDEPTQDIPLSFSYRIDGSTRSYSLGDCNMDEAAEEGYFVCKLPFSVSDAVDARWISIAGEYSGSQGPVRIYGMKFAYTFKERE